MCYLAVEGLRSGTQEGLAIRAGLSGRRSKLADQAMWSLLFRMKLPKISNKANEKLPQYFKLIQPKKNHVSDTLFHPHPDACRRVRQKGKKRGTKV